MSSSGDSEGKRARKRRLLGERTMLANEEAKKRLSTALETGSTTLNLSIPDLRRIPSLSQIRYLKTLLICGTKISSLAPLRVLTELEELRISDSKEEIDVGPISELRTLQKLHLDGVRPRNLQAISRLKSLTHLIMVGAKVFDLSPIASLSNLEVLNLMGTPVVDLTPLSKLTKLQSLSVSSTGVSDLSPLANMTSLIDGALAHKYFGLIHTYSQIKDATLRSFWLLDEQEGTVKTINYLRMQQGLPPVEPHKVKQDKMENAPLVLVVDDILSNTLLLKSKLEKNQFRVATAHSGPEALKTIAETPPDLILLDVMMPGMDGFEVCRRIRANPSTVSLPVIMVTALDQASDREAGLEAGANYFMTKPMNDVQLFGNIYSLTQERRNPLNYLKQDPLGARSEVVGDEFVLDLINNDENFIDRNLAEQFQREALRKANILLARSRSLANQRAWEDLPVATNYLIEQLSTDPSEYSKNSLMLWSLSVSLASFLGQSRTARDGISSFCSPLEPDVERALSDLVVTVAPFVRTYDTARTFDDQLAGFESEPPAIEAARAIAQRSGERHVLRHSDAQMTSLALGREAQRDIQSNKAHGFGYKTVLNHVGSLFLFIWGGGLKKLGEKVADRVVENTVLADRAAALLIEREQEVRQIYAAAPDDLREATDRLLEMTKDLIKRRE